MSQNSVFDFNSQVVSPCLSPHDIPRNRQISKAYADWSEKMTDWSGAVFGTLTFEFQPHTEEKAWKLVETFYWRLCYQYAKSKGLQHRWKRMAPVGVFAMERGTTGTKRLHAHFLLDKVASEVSYKAIHDVWAGVDKRLCGYSQIEPPRGIKGASYYVSKFAGYSAKGSSVLVYPDMADLAGGKR